MMNLQNEMSDLHALLRQKDSQLNAELEKNRKSVKDIETELQEQRNKNDVSIFYERIVNVKSASGSA